jgi:hypothetical protein
VNSKDIATARLISQQIAGSKFKKIKELVGWMGAIQAQDFIMAKWAIGVRVPGSTDKIVQAAVDKAEIIRTHILRPTWHFVSGDDIHWVLALSGPGLKSSMKGRDKRLGLTEADFKKSNKIIEKALSGGKHLTRDVLMAKLEKAKIGTRDFRSLHIMMRAELDGLVCSGVTNEKRQTYALLDERVPTKKILKKDEALAKLAKRYFTAHCPATLQDFMWWSGLNAADSKLALQIIKKDLVGKTVGLETYWFDKTFSFQKVKPAVYLLPAYDEYLISYKDRSASLKPQHRATALTGNGIFYPVVIANGQVVGLWKRAAGKTGIDLRFNFFSPLNKQQSLALKKEVQRFEAFTGETCNICE